MLPPVVRLCSLHGFLFLLLLGLLAPEGLQSAEDEGESALLERLDEQQRQIDELRRKIREAESQEPVQRKLSDRVLIGGQGAVAFFHTGSDGQFPNGEFRPDEARLFAEARIWRNVFVLSELNLVTREDPDEFFALGELYVDFENVSGLWGADNLLNLRLGRFYIPFGEEYTVRNPIPNPLISHSLSDIWGIDEGIAVFGRRGKFNYFLAVQNGSHSSLSDSHPDKSVAGRIGYLPLPWLSTSFSAMRTGKLDADRGGDSLSEVWFGDGFIRSLGDPAATKTFQADLLELDVAGRWQTGHLKAAGGVVFYRDDDPTAENEREAYYYYIEGKQTLTGAFYAAARFSQIYASDGFLIVGHGDRGKYFFSPAAPLTRDLWRMSFGLGYEFSPDLIAKLEVAREDGRLLDGTRRRDHDFVGAQLAFRF